MRRRRRHSECSTTSPNALAELEWRATTSPSYEASRSTSRLAICTPLRTLDGRRRLQLQHASGAGQLRGRGRWRRMTCTFAAPWRMRVIATPLTARSIRIQNSAARSRPRDLTKCHQPATVRYGNGLVRRAQQFGVTDVVPAAGHHAVSSDLFAKSAWTKRAKLSASFSFVFSHPRRARARAFAFSAP